MTRRLPKTDRRTSPVRWDPDLGEWQLRCDSCVTKGQQHFWPLSKEFWEPRYGMTQCRACHKAALARKARERLANDPIRRAAKYAATREARKVMWPIYEAARRERLLEQPEKLAERRAKNAEATRRYRTRLKAASEAMPA